MNCSFSIVDEGPCFKLNNTDALTPSGLCVSCQLSPAQIEALGNIEPSSIEVKEERIEGTIAHFDDIAITTQGVALAAQQEYEREQQVKEYDDQSGPNSHHFGRRETEEEKFRQEAIAKGIRKVTADNYVELAIVTESTDFEAIRSRFDNIYILRILHGCMGLSTEVGELTDNLKKFLFYGKNFDVINMEEEMGDIFWYMAILTHAMGRDNFQRMMQVNIDKLEFRYGNKFSEYDALNRDTDSERKILEQLKFDDLAINDYFQSMTAETPTVYIKVSPTESMDEEGHKHHTRGNILVRRVDKDNLMAIMETLEWPPKQHKED
jgi:NTP pyrophosphatase (non-canonical NTP hydrolase)